MSQRGIYGQSYRVKDDITSEDLFARIQHVIQREIDVVRNQLARNHVQAARRRTAASSTRTRSRVDGVDGRGAPRHRRQDRDRDRHRARPGRHDVAFDGRTVLDSDDILTLDWLPNSLVVVGAGVIGIEYASMFAALGTRVTVVEQRQRLLEFCDCQIIEALQYHLRDLGVIFRFGETVTGVDKHTGGAVTHLASGKRIPADAVLYSAGRQGATDDARPGEGRARGRRPRPHRRRRALPHRRRATSTRSAT